MRVGLAVIVAGLLILIQPRGTYVDHEWPALFTTAIVPSLVPIMLFVLMLDMLMARVWQSGASAAETTRLKTVIWFDAIMLLLLVVVWGPYFSALVVN